jgi:energy-coupling factor transporter ATP-binding protein EcfA2
MPSHDLSRRLFLGSLGATLALQPSILVFDEPTTDLDPIGKQSAAAFQISIAAIRQPDTARRSLE